MNERIRKLLNCFEPNMQKKLLDFCARISKVQADVFILMARKASCFFNCLEELGLIHFNGYVTSERILDMDCGWLYGKSVIVIDDAIVSGTTINRTIDKLIDVGVVSVEVHVLTVNSKWFQKDMLTNAKGDSYLYPNCNVETNEKCIELCYNVVKSILLQPRPYDIDFPYYNKIEIKEEYIEYLINKQGWDNYEITSVEQKANNIFALTIIPTESILKQFENTINCFFLTQCLVKLRLYGTYKDKNKKMYSLRIVPMIVFDKMPVIKIEEIFEDLVTQMDDKGLLFGRMFTSITSRLRLLQFYFSSKFAEFWVQSLPRSIGICVEHLTFEDRNLSFVFPEGIDKKVEELCKSTIVPVHMHIGVKIETNSNIEVSTLTEKDYISLETRLIEPFIKKYYNKEIPCRELVLEKGKRVFDNKEYGELLQRLNTGITVFDMIENIKYAQDYYDIYTRVSLFIDRAIDMGMIVPIIQIDNECVFRAYRHGEDVLFGKREEILYLKLLYEYEKNSKKGEGITHISAEKMIVLFSKIGVKLNILFPYISNFTTNPKDKNGEICKILRIKTYLKGPIALLAGADIHHKNKDKPFITDEGKSVWFTNTFIQKQKIIMDEMGRYHVMEVDTSSITKTDLKDVENIAILFGELCNPEIETGITFGDDELTKISTCLSLDDVVKAISAELNIFAREWEYIPLIGNKQVDERMLDDGKNCKIYEALNSAYMKLKTYENSEAKELLMNVKFQRATDQNLWESWFDDVLSEKISDDELKQEITNLFYESKYLSIFILYTYLILHLIQFINFKIYSKSKRYAYIIDSYQKITEYELILENMCIPDEYDQIINWKEIKKIKDAVMTVNPLDNIQSNVIVGIEESYICETVKYIQKSIDEVNVFLEKICCILGETGKVSKMNMYNHVLTVQFRARNELEKQSICRKIDYCYHYTLDKMENNKSTDSQRGSIKIEYLPPKSQPDIYMEDNTCMVWFVARGNGSDLSLTKLALNIFHKLYKNALFKEIYFGDISYKYSIKKSENRVSDFLCNSFYRFIEEIPYSVYKLIRNEPELIAIIEKKVYSKNQFIHFINKDSKAKNNYKKGESRDIETLSSEYTIEHYEHKYKYNPNKEKVMDKKDIGILTILPEETNAVIETLDLQEDNFIFGNRLYYSGYLQGNNTVHSVILTQQLEQGGVSIANAYNDMVNKYDPSIIFLVGIAGGITNDVDYCSVVLGKQVIAYDFIKDSTQGIQRRGESYRVNPEILSLYQRFSQIIIKNPIMAAPKSKTKYIHITESNIASGSAVIANNVSEIKKWIHTYNDKTFAVEMEAHGLSAAFYEGDLKDKHPQFGICIIRGISDMADENKNKVNQYRVPAAQNAAIVLKELVKLIPKI